MPAVKAKLLALLLVLAADTARAVPVPYREPRTKATTAQDRGPEAGDRSPPSARDRRHVSGAASQKSHGDLLGGGGAEALERRSGTECHRRLSEQHVRPSQLSDAAHNCIMDLQDGCELRVDHLISGREDAGTYDRFDVSCTTAGPVSAYRYFNGWNAALPGTGASTQSRHLIAT